LIKKLFPEEKGEKKKTELGKKKVAKEKKNTDQVN
jgi:hypothetical protein